MTSIEKQATVTCPECGNQITITLQTITVADVQQLAPDERYSNLKNIADQTGISLATLLAEAFELSPSLETALPLLESKYHICSTCGQIRQWQEAK